MSFSIEAWMRKYCEEMKKQFENRIWFIGLQGSYGRGEATEQSDIDVVLILDKITYEDLRTYSSLLERLPNREKICGFVSADSSPGRRNCWHGNPLTCFSFTMIQSQWKGLWSRLWSVSEKRIFSGRFIPEPAMCITCAFIT